MQWLREAKWFTQDYIKQQAEGLQTEGRVLCPHPDTNEWCPKHKHRGRTEEVSTWRNEMIAVGEKNKKVVALLKWGWAWNICFDFNAFFFKNYPDGLLPSHSVEEWKSVSAKSMNWQMEFSKFDV